jgi:hypothetical protein
LDDAGDGWDTIIDSGVETSIFNIEEMGKSIEKQVAVYSDQLN